jgi:hypothetical protein
MQHLQILRGYKLLNPLCMYKKFFQPADLFNLKAAPAILPLEPKVVQIIFTKPARTAKKAPHFTVTKINRLTLFKEIIAVYCEKHKKHINTLSGKGTEL